jgi:LruC domain-containing protein
MEATMSNKRNSHPIRRSRRLLVTAGLTLVVTFTAGLTHDQSGALSWTFLAGSYDLTHYDGAGIPLNLSSGPSFSAQWWQQLSAALPERQHIDKTCPSCLATDQQSTLRLTKDAVVTISFIHEGAGYRNSVGYFTFADGSPPGDKDKVSETVIFPNASLHNDGGSSSGLRAGDTVTLGTFTKGTNIGFFVAANGFSSSSGVKTYINPSKVYYTLRGLNAEPEPLGGQPDLRAHTVVLYEDLSQGGATDRRLVIGLEDLNRTSSGCDNDFNDVMLLVQSNPPDAIDVTQIQQLPQTQDSDGDGVLDSYDDYPQDSQRSFDVYYPSGSTGTLAFEDNWPIRGDYDMNDLVLSYRFKRTLDAGGKLKEIEADLRVTARGAGYRNGFAIQIPGVSAGAVASATLQRDEQAAAPIAAEAQQPSLVYTIFSDAHTHTTPAPGCSYFNTEAGCPAQTGTRFRLRVVFSQSRSEGALGYPPYNPFIFRSAQRGLEIHLPGKPPTALASAALFSTGDDATSPSTGYTYKTADGDPWALDVPNAWPHPLEQRKIHTAYTHFSSWARSSGGQHKDWYLHSTSGRVFQ